MAYVRDMVEDGLKHIKNLSFLEYDENADKLADEYFKKKNKEAKRKRFNIKKNCSKLSSKDQRELK